MTPFASPLADLASVGGPRRSEQRSCRVAALVSITALCINLVAEVAPYFAPAAPVVQSWTHAVLYPAVVCYALAAWLQRGRFNVAGKVLLTLTAIFQIVTLALLAGVESHVQLFLVLPLVSSVLIFSSSQRSWRAFAMVASGAALVGIEVAFAYLGVRRYLPIDSPSVVRMYLVIDTVLLVLALCSICFFAARETENHEATLEREQRRNLALLENMLPPSIVKRLMDGEARIAERHENVSVLFADLVGFTAFSRGMPAVHVVELLDDLFRAFDDVAETAGAEKIKTIGDAYMVVVGLDGVRTDHAAVAARVGLRMMDALALWNTHHGLSLGLRVGVHSGEIVAGVIGRRRFAFDLWGDTVNTASRMEAHGEPGSVVVSAATAAALGAAFDLHERDSRFIKGLGDTVTWLVRQKFAGESAGESALESTAKVRVAA